MVRRDAFLAAGGFDRDFDAHEDLDLYLRLARDGALVPTPGEPVTLYRVHGDEHAVGRALPRARSASTAKHLAGARGRARRALLERRVDALWSLGEFRAARREAARAALAEPLPAQASSLREAAAGIAAPTQAPARRAEKDE